VTTQSKAARDQPAFAKTRTLKYWAFSNLRFTFLESNYDNMSDSGGRRCSKGD
jgi:hypothetical protein